MEDSNRMTTEDRINQFILAAESILDPGRDVILKNEKLKNWLKENNYFTAPASTKYHGAYEGGLFDHSYQVYKRLLELTVNNGLQWERPESPFIIGMFHDLCKCDQYIKKEGFRSDIPGIDIVQYNAGYHYEYNVNTLLKGHGSKSVMLLSQFMSLTEEEMLCIRYHMGPYGNEVEQKEEWAGYDLAIRKTGGLCLWANTADMIASKLDGT